ncbi:hypothetical protein [Streptomyces akebiae]|nr:hypothetical protein [Streptomyces akebiae]
MSAASRAVVSSRPAISKVTVIELAIPSLVLRVASDEEWCLS